MENVLTLALVVGAAALGINHDYREPVQQSVAHGLQSSGAAVLTPGPAHSCTCRSRLCVNHLVVPSLALLVLVVRWVGSTVHVLLLNMIKPISLSVPEVPV